MPPDDADTRWPKTEPLPVTRVRVTWTDTIASFRFREYRWYASGLLCASIGLWIARIATDWLVLEITGDVALLGIVIAAQLLPPMLFGVWGGVVSDWLPPRTSVILTQSLFAGLFAWLGTLVLTGGVGEGWVLAISVLVGFVSCIDGPSRAVLTHQAVGSAVLPNAISVNAVLPQLGGVLGAALAGVAISTLDVGWTMIAAATGLFMGAIATLFIRTAALEVRPRRRPARGGIRDAIRYAASKPTISISLLTVGVLSLSGLSASVLYAWMAETKFDVGAAGYSLFATVGSAGAMIGGLVSTRRRRFTVLDNAAMLALSGAVWLTCGLTPWISVFLLGILAAGMARMVFLVGNDTLVQLSSNLAVRARIVSLYLMTATGGQVIGSILLGWMVSRFGGDVAFIITGLAPLITASAICVVVLVRSGRWSLRVG